MILFLQSRPDLGEKRKQLTKESYDVLHALMEKAKIHINKAEFFLKTYKDDHASNKDGILWLCEAHGAVSGLERWESI
jgi:hypothetical protein